jgi:hypothetical protein
MAPDFYNLNKKDQEKFKIEVIRLVDINGPELHRSNRIEFEKKHQYSLEIN